MSSPGVIFLIITCLFLPYAAIRSALRIRSAPGGKTPGRPQYLTSFATTQAFSLILALSAARYESIELFPPPHARAAPILAAGAFLLVTLGTLPARWAWKPRPERERVAWIYPHRPRDLWWWALVALTAGIVEEIVFRGVMFTLWMRVLHSWWAAAGICTIVFTLAHFTQGWRAMAVIVLMTLAMHGLVRLSGDLYAAMAVHFVYDLAAGMIVSRRLRREGIVPD